MLLDEIDLIGEGVDSGEAGTRLKTELLIQMDRITAAKKAIIVVAITNKPWLLRSPITKRFPKIVYLDFPNAHCRQLIF